MIKLKIYSYDFKTYARYTYMRSDQWRYLLPIFILERPRTESKHDHVYSNQTILVFYIWKKKGYQRKGKEQILLRSK